MTTGEKIYEPEFVVRVREIVEQYDRQCCDRGLDAQVEPLASLLDLLPHKALKHNGYLYCLTRRADGMPIIDRLPLSASDDRPIVINSPSDIPPSLPVLHWAITAIEQREREESL